MQSDSDTDDSVLSEGARAANDRLAPKTQRDYSVYIKQLTRFACHPDRRAEFADCLNGNEVIMPVALKLGKAFVVSLRDKLVPWPMDGRPEGERTYLKHYSCSKINNACLAIKNTFRKLSQPVPFADASFYLDFAQSYGQIIAREKGVGAYPAVEGSIALGSAQIKKVINAAFRYVPEGRGRAQSAVGRLWLFLLMALATLGRGERVSRIQFSCITAFCDAFTIQIPTSKSDILGLMSYAKLCYANCEDPTCCLATALGVEFLSRLPTGNFQYLFGESGETSCYIVQQMSAALRTIIDSVGAENLGTVIERLTTHFLKKTGLRILRDHAAGIIDNDSRELRADHKVGPYCQRSEQDGVVGRTLAFLKPGTSSFGLSPPHFHETIVRAIPWNRIVPGYSNYSTETRQAVHVAVASAIVNSEFLTKNLSRSHPFHGCPLMSTEKQWLGILKPYVLGGMGPFTSCLVATGCSLISNMAMEVHSMRQGGQGGGGALASEDRVQINGLMQAVEHLTKVITGQSNSTAQIRPDAANAWSRIMPRMWIDSAFRFPVGVKLRDAWFRWHCGEHPLRVVTSKMLPKTPTGEDPSERERQCVLRRKFKGVFQIIQGQTRDSVVDMDAEYVWDVSWNRIVSLFNISLPCNWVVSTAFDFFHRSPQLVSEAKAFPSVAVPDVAVAAAARSAKVAEDSRTFAVAALQAPTQRRQLGAAPTEAAPVLNQFSDEAAAAVAIAIADVAGVDALQPHVMPAVLAPRAEPHGAGTSARRSAPAASARRSAPAESLPDPFSMLQQPPYCIALNPYWPVPTNLWMPGAVQCALCCPTCRIGAWQASHRGMLTHYRAVHGSICQLSLKEANVSGEQNVVVVESCWCIKGIEGNGNASAVQLQGGGSWTPCKRQRLQ